MWMRFIHSVIPLFLTFLLSYLTLGITPSSHSFSLQSINSSFAEARNPDNAPQPFRIVELKSRQTIDTSDPAATPQNNRRENLIRALQVPIISYSRRARDGSLETVDFVGAIHLAEAEYYHSLNKGFETYDAVLYELVADRDALPNKTLADTPQGKLIAPLNNTEDRSVNPVRLIQGTLAKILGLQFQLDGINYHAKNFVHADLSPSELSAAMKSRGESLPSILVKLFKLQSSRPRADGAHQETTPRAASRDLNSIDPLKLLLIGPSAAEQRELRAYLAEGIISSEDLFKALQDDGGLALIDDRNAAIIKVMRQQFNHGHQDLAVFYGVGHLQDLHHRLTHEEGFKLGVIKWLNAWLF